MVLPGTSNSNQISSALPKRETGRTVEKQTRSFGDELRSQQKRQADVREKKKALESRDSQEARQKLKDGKQGLGQQPEAQRPLENPVESPKGVVAKQGAPQRDGEAPAASDSVPFVTSKNTNPQAQMQVPLTMEASVLDNKGIDVETTGQIPQADDGDGAEASALTPFKVVADSEEKTTLSKSLSANLTSPEGQFLQKSGNAQGLENPQALTEALKSLESSDVAVDPKLLKNIESVPENLVLKEASPNGILKEAAASTSSAKADTVVSALSALAGAVSQGESSQNGEGGENSESNNGQQNFLESFGARQGEATTTSGVVGSKSFTQALVDAQNQADGKSIDNMPSIVRQVRTFVNDGGGSMNIELSPEGMGNINLKVAVENGQVNVEMLADNQVAKKALEETLVDMKASLENQKLSVETLKVDFSKDYEKDFSQNQNFMSDQQKRDEAQQFMEQFKQEREERVNSLFGGMQSYIKEPKQPELGLRAGGYFGSTKGRSVNLVA